MHNKVPTTVLITGASGFIGRGLQAFLLSNNIYKQYKIILLSSKSNDRFTTIDPLGYSFSSEAFVKNGINHIDIIIHLGAFTPKTGSEANNYYLSFSNINNTLHLINNLPNTPGKFVFISTIDVYQTGTNNIIDENTNTIPGSLYGWSKLYCEKMLKQWSDEKKVCLQIIRLGHIYGKWEDAYQKIIPLTIKTILNNSAPKIFTNGTELRSFLNISDCSRLIWQSIFLDGYNGPVNIASSHSITIIDLVNLIIKLSGSVLKPEFVQGNVEAIDYVFNVERMHKLLGTESVNLTDGLTEEIEYIKGMMHN